MNGSCSRFVHRSCGLGQHVDEVVGIGPVGRVGNALVVVGHIVLVVDTGKKNNRDSWLRLKNLNKRNRQI